MKEEDDKPILEFRDRWKVDGVLNDVLLVVVTATIANHSASWILIEDGSYCDIVYLFIFMRLGLHKRYLTPYEVEIFYIQWLL